MSQDKQSAIEAAARAVANHLTPGWEKIHADKTHWHATHGMLEGIYSDENEPFQDDCREAARAAILAFRQWLADEGLVVVPRDATQEMTGVVLDACAPRLEIMKTYTAMISAAPDALREGE